MRTIVLVICILLSSWALAQRECASSAYIEEQKVLHPDLSRAFSDVETFVQRQKVNTRVSGEGALTLIRIPVVVHVIYNNASQNISDTQVKSQIEALNRDFRRDNADSVNTPARFRTSAADVRIEFALATTDPKGRPANGITRKRTNVSYWERDDKIKFSAYGGDDAWDSRYYLNIWVGNLQYAIGYSSLPGGPAEKDGVVIATSVFGTINVASPFNLGRTAVHEVGHWLGLKHIWGDYYCGDDLVDDTPKQGNFTSGCPNGFRSSCNNGTTGDMYMNYMDYTADACMNLFTVGQMQRMRSLFNFGGPRNSLLSSTGLYQPWFEEAPVEEVLPVPSATLYPNPAGNEIRINLDSSWMGKTLRIINASGVLQSTIQVHSKEQKIDLSSLKAGVYFLQGFSGNEKLSEKFIKL
jgi:hypothetical protein